jgi:hypothetical protein
MVLKIMKIIFYCSSCKDDVKYQPGPRERAEMEEDKKQSAQAMSEVEGVPAEMEERQKKSAKDISEVDGEPAETEERQNQAAQAMSDDEVEPAELEGAKKSQLRTYLKLKVDLQKWRSTKNNYLRKCLKLDPQNWRSTKNNQLRICVNLKMGL